MLFSFEPSQLFSGSFVASNMRRNPLSLFCFVLQQIRTVSSDKKHLHRRMSCRRQNCSCFGLILKKVESFLLLPLGGFMRGIPSSKTSLLCLHGTLKPLLEKRRSERTDSAHIPAKLSFLWMLHKKASSEIAWSCCVHRGHC